MTISISFRATEERAQSAEERVLSMEAALKDAAERIRELERQVAKTPDKLDEAAATAAAAAQTKSSLLQPQDSTATAPPTALGAAGAGASGSQRAASHNTLLSPTRVGSGSSVESQSSVQKRPKSRGGGKKKK